MITLLYDGTFEGLLTCIYDGFYYKTNISCIYNKNSNYIPLLLDNIIDVNTNLIKFSKVKSSIIKKINNLCLKKIYMTYLSNYNDKEILIFNYLKIAFNIGWNIHSFLHIDEVRLIDKINKSVNNEIHRFRGFIRFKYIDLKDVIEEPQDTLNTLNYLEEYLENNNMNTLEELFLSMPFHGRVFRGLNYPKYLCDIKINNNIYYGYIIDPTSDKYISYYSFLRELNGVYFSFEDLTRLRTMGA